jgi:hypothetical protein
VTIWWWWWWWWRRQLFVNLYDISYPWDHIQNHCQRRQNIKWRMASSGMLGSEALVRNVAVTSNWRTLWRNTKSMFAAATAISSNNFEGNLMCFLASWPPLWSSCQSFLLQIQRPQVLFPVLPDFLRSRGYGMGSTQFRDDNRAATWMKSSSSGLENRFSACSVHWLLVTATFLVHRFLSPWWWRR